MLRPQYLYFKKKKINWKRKKKNIEHLSSGTNRLSEMLVDENRYGGKMED